MKKMKKFLALLIAMAMVLGMGTVSAFADGSDGTITVDNAAVGKKYLAYKIFDATYNGDAIAYTTTTPNVFTGSPFTVADEADSNGDYSVTITEGQNVDDISTWIAANISKFSSISASQGVDESDLATATTVKWTGLAYGYYYITSALGAEVTITSVAKEATVQDKNTTNPENPEKTVDEASAKIGDPVNFTVTLTATNFITTNTTNEETGEVTATTEKVTKYTVLDSADGFNYVIDTDHPVKYKVGNRDEVTVNVAKITYTNQTDSANGTMTFEIPWVDANGNSLYNYQEIITITYSGTVNKYAVDGKAENTVKVSNNTGKNSVTDSAETTTAGFTIAKVDGDNYALKGAKFRLYDAKTNGNEIPVVFDSVNGYYRVAEAGETGVEIEANKGNNENLATIKGLDNDNNIKYWIEETVPPKGYNKLDVRQEAKAGSEATIDVVNQAGSTLPATGGIGTTIFYIVGAILVVGAGVVLITRRRMDA